MLIFGPVPSRRLGQSLGINHIPPKTCSYSCVYCQLGRTNRMRIKRSEYLSPASIYEKTERKLENIGGEHVDYITFVPEGEPTLDKNLGEHIDRLRPLGIKIAVITNASLLWIQEVRQDLKKADLVSIKIDAVHEEVWKNIDRPHGALMLDRILQGAKDFADTYKGRLVTETMLVRGVNDHTDHLHKLADRIQWLNPYKAYILVPTRPSAEDAVAKPTAKTIRNAYDILVKKGIDPQCIVDDEEDRFYFSNDFVNDLLSIVTVHPVKEEVIIQKMNTRGMDESVLHRLIQNKMICVHTYEGKKFYIRNV